MDQKQPDLSADELMVAVADARVNHEQGRVHRAVVSDTL